jgi:phosphoglycerate kinase
MKQGGFFKRTIRDVPLDGKTVLVRADYNVPLEGGTIKDDYRIRSSVPTLQALLERGCKVVIISHLGRPEGQRVPELSLQLVSERLSELLGTRVDFVDDCIGDAVSMAVKNAPKKAVLLLENVRFYPGDETNDVSFAEQLAKSSGASYFVQDGFGVAHRAQASTSAITQFLPSVAGLLLEKEYTAITSAMEQPKRPLVAVMGGAKISDKIQLVERFVEIADKVIIGGAMANNFLKYKGNPVGKSRVEEGVDGVIEKVYAAAKDKVGDEQVDSFLYIPRDVAVAPEISADARRVNKTPEDVNEDDIILDVGSTTMDGIDAELEGAGTVIWNGTLGYSELPEFAHGSARLALHLASHPEITSIIGGGDTADFVLHWDAAEGKSFSLVSTGGGASLELMAGKKLPGVEALMDA